VLQPAPPLDPLDAPDAAAATIDAHRAAGATGLAVRFRHRSPAHFVEQLDALRAMT